MVNSFLRILHSMEGPRWRLRLSTSHISHSHLDIATKDLLKSLETPIKDVIHDETLMHSNHWSSLSFLFGP